MDDHLNKGLKADPWAEKAPFMRVMGPVDVVRHQRRYADWCEFLCLLAGQLNVGIDSDHPWAWTENARRHRWRAIDVERALFQYYRCKKNNPEDLKRLLKNIELLKKAA